MADQRCIEKWTIIAFQDRPINTSAYTERATVYGELTTELTNFWNFDDVFLEDFKEPLTGLWKLKFEWELENSILAEVVWTQNYNPNTCNADYLTNGCTSSSKPGTPAIEIISANLISCSSRSVSDDITLDLGYQNEWKNCQSGLERNTIFSETATKPMENSASAHHFKGLLSFFRSTLST